MRRVSLCVVLLAALAVAVSATPEMRGAFAKYFGDVPGSYMRMTPEMKAHIEAQFDAAEAQLPEHTVRVMDALNVPKPKRSFQSMSIDDPNDHDPSPDDAQYERVDARGARDERVRARRNLNSIARLYTIPVFPTCVQYAMGAEIPGDVMHPNATGLIQPLGNYTNAEKSKEYFIIACPFIDRPTDTQTQVRATYTRRAFSVGNEAFAEIKIELLQPSNAAATIRNLTHFGHFEFNDRGVIIGFKILFERLELRSPEPVTVTEAVMTARINRICTTIVTFYNDTSIPIEDQYAWAGNPTGVDCVAFLSAPMRKLRNNYMWSDQDSEFCREFHLGIVTFNDGWSHIATDPAVIALLKAHRDTHMTHVGPRGGGKCEDHPLANFQWYPN